MSKKYVVFNKAERQYISVESMFDHRYYVITSIEKEAYIFGEQELEQTYFIADVWEMEVLEVSLLVKL